MANQRKQIIINEIAFWKQSKMLPGHYCDYLTSLYTGGEVEQSEATAEPSKSILALEKKAAFRKFMFFPVLAILALVGLQFLPIKWLAYSIGLVLGIVLAVVGIKLAVKKNVAAPLVHVSSALLILWTSVQAVITYFPNQNTALFIVTAVNCALWLLLGLWQKIIYFTLAGGLGVLTIVGYALFFA
jgi:hypothetical protein